MGETGFRSVWTVFEPRKEIFYAFYHWGVCQCWIFGDFSESKIFGVLYHWGKRDENFDFGHFCAFFEKEKTVQSALLVFKVNLM